jgi:uncharacterized membrane protein
VQQNQNLSVPVVLLIVGVIALLGDFVIFKASSSVGPIMGLIGIVLVPSSLYTLSKRVKSPSLSKAFKSIIVVLIAAAIYALITLAGTLGNLDTTGQASSGARSFALIVFSLVTVIGLIIVYRKKA